MPDQIFTETTAFFNKLHASYLEANKTYCVELPSVERVKQQKPNAEADFEYIYTQIALFDPLKDGISKAIEKYKSTNIILRSRNEIDQFILSLQTYCQFFDNALKDFSEKLTLIDASIKSQRAAIAALAEFGDVAASLQSSDHKKHLTKNVVTLKLLIEQKHTIYAFGKVALLSYEMLSEIFVIYQTIKKKPTLLPMKYFNTIDYWMEKYQKERGNELNVSTSFNSLILEGFRQFVSAPNPNEPQHVTPLKRYTFENRRQVYVAPMKAVAVPTPSVAPTPSVEPAHAASTPTTKDTKNWQSLKTAADAYSTCILQLKEKTNELIAKGRWSNNYNHVAQVAKGLISKLETTPDFFKNPRPITQKELTDFVQNCKIAIDEARGEFRKHRSFLGQLNPILKNILGVLAAFTLVIPIVVQLKSQHGYIGTFFRDHSTDSSRKLNVFAANTNDIMDQLSQTI